MGKNRERKKIEKALRKKGFVKKEGSNHRVYILSVDGLKTSISTIISRGSGYKVYSASLLGQMKGQLKLTNKQLLDLIDCPLSKEDYMNHLSNMGLLKK